MLHAVPAAVRASPSCVVTPSGDSTSPGRRDPGTSVWGLFSLAARAAPPFPAPATLEEVDNRHFLYPCLSRDPHSDYKREGFGRCPPHKYKNNFIPRRSCP